MMKRIRIKITKEELRELVKTRKRKAPPTRRHRTQTDYRRKKKHVKNIDE